MRSIFFYILFFNLTFFVFKGYAQVGNPYEKNIGFGIKGGVSITNLSAGSSGGNPLSTGYSSFLGPDGALFAEIKFSNLLSLQPMLEYSAEGGKKNGLQAFPTPTQVVVFFPAGTAPPYLYANFKNRVKLDYLMLPVLLKFSWNFEGSPFRIYADGGPFAGYLLSAKQVSSGSSQVYSDPSGAIPLPAGTQSFNSDMDLKSQLQTFNYGVEGNVGLAYRVDGAGRNFIFIEGIGNYGLRNIQKDPDNGKNSTGAAIISLGYSVWF